jgi:hypothetical protein
MEEVRDRYVTFMNIDCYENSVLVIDAMNELFKKIPESKNDFWQTFMAKIPEDYGQNFCKEGEKDILYLICANVFYISDLFEEYDFEKGEELLDRCELECC